MTTTLEQSALGCGLLQSMRLEKTLGALECITSDALSSGFMNKIPTKLSMLIHSCAIL